MDGQRRRARAHDRGQDFQGSPAIRRIDGWTMIE